MLLETDGILRPVPEGNFVINDLLACRYQVDYRAEVAIETVL